jgi:hypothetical protein
MKIMMTLCGGAVVLAVGFLGWQSARLSPDVELGSASPDVALATLDGVDLPVSSLRGKIVLLDFWNTT